MTTPVMLVGYFLVPVFGAMVCAGPAVTRPGVAFGVRVPAEHASAPVIRRQRDLYVRYTAIVTACATAAVFLSWGHGSWWLGRIILALELAAELACYLRARRRIAEAKRAGRWFAGQRPAVVADTRWRTEPERVPVRWLIPALAVIAATTALRLAYGPPAARGPAGGFAVVIGQVFVTTLWTGLVLLFYRSRPDLDPADPTASLQWYRRLLGTYARAALVMVALINVTLLLHALQVWHVARPPVPLVLGPAVAGLLTLIGSALWAGRDRAEAGTARLGRARAAGVTAQDDDRWWKMGLVYVHHDDPAIVVPARFGAGWTLNFGNPSAWLVVAAIVAGPAGLALLFS
jgi:uncharacterized membrane protein